MAFHQQRLINLVDESDRNLARIADFTRSVRELLVDLRVSDKDKLLAIAARITTILGGAEKTYLLLERERIKYTRRKNMYMREYMQRKRTGQPERRAHVPAGPADNEEIITCDDGTVMTRAEFDAQLNAEMGELPPLALDAERPPSSAPERELARARELGAEEARKNAERLARADPFAEESGS